jgi:hypothetical protein
MDAIVKCVRLELHHQMMQIPLDDAEIEEFSNLYPASRYLKRTIKKIQ